VDRRAGFLTAVFFFAGLALVDFLAAFLEALLGAGLVLREAFFAAGACFRRAGAFTAGVGAELAGIKEDGMDGPVAGGMTGLAGAMGPAAGVFIASSQPGVNISSRSREMAFARPHRGHRAS
jgi:hypothetical protein